MRAVIQRVSRAEVAVEGRVVSRIGPGLLILLGIGRGDDRAAVERLAAKVPKLRIFDDEQGRPNVALGEREILCVSQFTLYGDTRKGQRPSFSEAANPELAAALFDRFCESLEAEGVSVERGQFGAMMEVELTNDGPVTLMLEA